MTVIRFIHYLSKSVKFLPAGTPYAGGLFRVRLVLSKDFPSSPPKGYFVTKIFHPNVARNGEICVNTLKKDWKSDLGLKHILLVSVFEIKSIKLAVNPEPFFKKKKIVVLLLSYLMFSYNGILEIINNIICKQALTF